MGQNMDVKVRCANLSRNGYEWYRQTYKDIPTSTILSYRGGFQNGAGHSQRGGGTCPQRSSGSYFKYTGAKLTGGSTL
jgi:hypothetical protein